MSPSHARASQGYYFQPFFYYYNNTINTRIARVHANENIFGEIAVSRGGRIRFPIISRALLPVEEADDKIRMKMGRPDHVLRTCPNFPPIPRINLKKKL